jgi:hypothetical protein
VASLRCKVTPDVGRGSAKGRSGDSLGFEEQEEASGRGCVRRRPAGG